MNHNHFFTKVVVVGFFTASLLALFALLPVLATASLFTVAVALVLLPLLIPAAGTAVFALAAASVDFALGFLTPAALVVVVVVFFLILAESVPAAALFVLGAAFFLLAAVFVDVDDEVAVEEPAAALVAVVVFAVPVVVVVAVPVDLERAFFTVPAAESLVLAEADDFEAEVAASFFFAGSAELDFFLSEADDASSPSFFGRPRLDSGGF